MSLRAQRGTPALRAPRPGARGIDKFRGWFPVGNFISFPSRSKFSSCGGVPRSGEVVFYFIHIIANSQDHPGTPCHPSTGGELSAFFTHVIAGEMKQSIGNRHPALRAPRPGPRGIDKFRGWFPVGNFISFPSRSKFSSCGGVPRSGEVVFYFIHIIANSQDHPGTPCHPSTGGELSAFFTHVIAGEMKQSIGNRHPAPCGHPGSPEGNLVRFFTLVIPAQAGIGTLKVLSLIIVQCS